MEGFFDGAHATPKGWLRIGGMNMEILFRHLDFTGRVFVGWTVSPIKEEPGPAARVGLAVQVGEYGRLRPFETLEPPLGESV